MYAGVTYKILFGIKKKEKKKCPVVSVAILLKEVKARLAGSLTTIGSIESGKVTLSKIKPQLQVNL